jgi:hypothetical protein
MTPPDPRFEEADPGDIGAKRTVIAADCPTHPADFSTPSVQEQPSSLPSPPDFAIVSEAQASEQRTEAQKKVSHRLLTV